MMDPRPERSDLSDSVRGRQEGTAVDWAASLLVTLLAIALIEIISRTISVMPVPGPILLLAVVYAAFTGGTLAGLASALLVILYELCFCRISLARWRTATGLFAWRRSHPLRRSWRFWLECCGGMCIEARFRAHSPKRATLSLAGFGQFPGRLVDQR